MSEFGQQVIFKQLFDRYDRVEIPLIQRDFAQGRESAAETREEFLDAIQEVLSLPENDPKLPLNLDFIYGSVEGESPIRFLPLDGQQRLTTLFLLHWYAAWKHESLDEFRSMYADKRDSRFSYSVRPSSTEFFDELIHFEIDSLPDSSLIISELIKDQAWYFRHWRLDPTIQSTLHMLDAIHAKFYECQNMFSRLMDEHRPVITFQLLDLANFGLSDDLYIKMNARGKPLTSFETFKARYEQELSGQFGDEFRIIGDKKFPVAEYFSRQMDTCWADFFWAHRDLETNLFDNAVMNVFRTAILISREPEHSEYEADIVELRKRQLSPTYTLFKDRNWIDKCFSDKLLLLLNAWMSKPPALTKHLPNSRYFDEIGIFEKIANDTIILSYSEIVQLVAYTIYLEEHAEKDIIPDAFQTWMRIVFNLASNTNYDRPSDLQRSVLGLKEIRKFSGDALHYFSENEDPLSGFSQQQILEERLKAKLLISNENWRDLIDEAEGHGYFRGQIEFLLDFCGAWGSWHEETQWTEDEHRSFQQEFRRNLSIAEGMFSDSGVEKDELSHWERALLCIGDYLLPSGTRNHSLLINAPTESGSWKRLLRGTGTLVTKRNMLHSLWNRLSSEHDIRDQLKVIIEEQKDIPLWRQTLVSSPEAINYCTQRLVRRQADNEIYLLKRSQMNGAHAELFTYGIYRQFQSNKFFDSVNMQSHSYYEPSETASEPGIQFFWLIGDESVCFDVIWEESGFLIYTKPDDIECSDLAEILSDNGFEYDDDDEEEDDEERGYLSKSCTQNELSNCIRNLDIVIQKYKNGISVSD